MKHLACFLTPVIALVTSARLHAGLSEATDYVGPWTTGSPPGQLAPPGTTYPWEGQAVTSLDGKGAAMGPSLGIVDAPYSWIQTTLTGPTTLYFSYHYASSGFFSVQWEGPAVDLSAVRWREMALAIPARSTTVRWQVRAGESSGARPYIDQVWTSADPRPRITDTAKRAGQFGSAFSWQVPVNSATPASLAATGLPPGLTVDSDTRVIHGTPTAAATFEATLTALNGSGQHIANVTFEVAPGTTTGTTTIAEALDASTLVFTQAGNGAAWGGMTGFAHDGVDSARGVASNDTSTFLSTAVNGPGTLSFWYWGETWAANPPVNYSTIRLYVGAPPPIDPMSLDYTPFQSTGGPDWYQGTAQIPAGPQHIYWRAWAYAAPADERHAYLDEVAFVASTVPPQSTFAAWQTAWNVVGQPVTADTDGDGLTLGMEYALGGSPYVANPELLPVVSVVDGYFTINVIKAPSPTDLTYLVQASKDLAPNSWTTSTVEVFDEDSTHLLAHCKKTVAEQPASYLRVKVLVDP